MNLLTAWQMSNQWRIPPSDLYHIIDPLAAYYFNRAVLYFGQAYEEDINDATSGAKSESAAKRSAEVVRQRWMNDVEGPNETPQSKEQKFRDPAETFAEMKRRREQTSGEL